MPPPTQDVVHKLCRSRARAELIVRAKAPPKSAMAMLAAGNKQMKNRRFPKRVTLRERIAATEKEFARKARETSPSDHTQPQKMGTLPLSAVRGTQITSFAARIEHKNAQLERGLAIESLAFQRLVQEVVDDVGVDLRVDDALSKTLRDASEMMLVHHFEG
nr:hypothetical protein B0A51_04448 [Rachicladosporium sp. CCFEE 5018]